MSIDPRVKAWAETYQRDGYVAGVPIISGAEAAKHRASMEWAEGELDTSLHYKSKIHTILTSPYELATHPLMLDLVEALIGPDILLYNVTYIIKEPGSTSHVSWHQDLTYWGLSHDDQVSAWLALSPANEESGCMRMLPGSHTHGMVTHETTEDANNVLLQGQTVRGIDESCAKLCPLRPGEASFHHGWTLHASMPNVSQDRRIGLNIQYLAAHVRQTKHDLDTAMLVRGRDSFHHLGVDIPAGSDLEPAAIKRQAELENLHVETAGTA
ncbi:MAG: phytanoyl-CoA dioxygenase family protein [Pseudomonadota bacterium]